MFVQVANAEDANTIMKDKDFNKEVTLKKLPVRRPVQYLLREVPRNIGEDNLVEELYLQKLRLKRHDRFKKALV